MTAIILALLTAHWFADFVCQTNGMALHKSRSWGVLTWHVAVYSMVMAAAWAVVSGLYVPPETGVRMIGYNGVNYGPSGGAWFVPITFALHWLTDAVTSRITSRLWFVLTPSVESVPAPRTEDMPTDAPNPIALKVTNRFDDRKRHWFFVMIGFDQLLHVWALVLTAQWCLR